LEHTKYLSYQFLGKCKLNVKRRRGDDSIKIDLTVIEYENGR